jgi:hypothetical protein
MALSYCLSILFVTSSNLIIHFSVSGSSHSTFIAKFDNILAICILVSSVFIFACSIDSVVVSQLDLANEYASFSSLVNFALLE